MAWHRSKKEGAITNQSPADKLLSYTTHDGEGQTTIHPRMGLPWGDVGMGDIPATKTVK